MPQNTLIQWLTAKHPIIARIAVWVGLLLVIYFLRSFFLLIFLTFVFSFLQFSAGEKLKSKIHNRRLRTWIIGVVLLLVLSGIIYFLATEVKIQTKLFINNFDKYISAIDDQINTLSEKFPAINQVINDAKHSAEASGASVNSPTLLILQQGFDLPSESNGGNIKKGMSQVFLYSGKIFGITGSFLLSLLFSFLIILDLSHLERSLAKMEKSKFAFVFQEVKPDIVKFSQLLGKAFEAQFFIAVVNSFLTGIGLYALGLWHYSAFLISIVFFCSFIPIAGVFASSVPIFMVALQSGGLFLSMLAIGLIILIHTVETYILNPCLLRGFLQNLPQFQVWCEGAV